MREARAVLLSIGRFDGCLTGVSSISIALLENKLRIDFSTFESICTIRVRSHWRGKRVILYRKGGSLQGKYSTLRALGYKVTILLWFVVDKDVHRRFG